MVGECKLSQLQFPYISASLKDASAFTTSTDLMGLVQLGVSGLCFGFVTENHNYEEQSFYSGIFFKKKETDLSFDINAF